MISCSAWACQRIRVNDNKIWAVRLLLLKLKLTEKTPIKSCRFSIGIHTKLYEYQENEL